MKIRIMCGISAYVRIQIGDRIFKTDKQIANLLGFDLTKIYVNKLVKEVFIDCFYIVGTDVHYGFTIFKPKERIEIYLERFKKVFENELILAKLGGE